MPFGYHGWRGVHQVLSLVILEYQSIEALPAEGISAEYLLMVPTPHARARRDGKARAKWLLARVRISH